MPRLLMNFDLRHPPEFPTSGAEVYAAALDMCQWADEHGFAEINLPEHHQNYDGYLPAPLMFAAAVGGRTTRVKVGTGIAIGTLFHPIRLAEEAAVADLCLQGRLLLRLGLGVLREDYELFGIDFTRRGRILDELIPVLRQAWTGEPFEYRGSEVRVTPRPVQDPMPIYLGGMSQAAADRAARLADGFYTAMPQSWEMYRAACQKHGKPDPGPRAPRGPMFLWITKEDKVKTLERLQPHLEQQIRSYADQARKSGANPVNPWEVRPDSTAPYDILYPDETIELVQQLGVGGELIIQPLLAGIPPALAWEMLDTLQTDVLPHLPR